MPVSSLQAFSLLSSGFLKNRLFADRRHDTHENAQAWNAALDAIEAQDAQALQQARQNAEGCIEPISRVGKVRRARLAKRVVSMLDGNLPFAASIHTQFFQDDQREYEEEVRDTHVASGAHSNSASASQRTEQLALQVWDNLWGERHLSMTPIAWHLDPELFALSVALQAQAQANSKRHYTLAIGCIVREFSSWTHSPTAKWMIPCVPRRATEFEGLFGLPVRALDASHETLFAEENLCADASALDTPTPTRSNPEKKRERILEAVRERSEAPHTRPVASAQAFTRAQEKVCAVGLFEVLERLGSRCLNDPEARKNNKSLWMPEASGIEVWARELLTSMPDTVPESSESGLSPQQQLLQALTQEVRDRAHRQQWGLDQWNAATRCLLLGSEALAEGRRPQVRALFAAITGLFWEHNPEALLPLRRDDTVRLSTLFSTHAGLQNVLTDERLGRWIVQAEGDDQRLARFLRTPAQQEWAPMEFDPRNRLPSLSDRQSTQALHSWSLLDWSAWFSRTGATLHAASLGGQLTPGLSNTMCAAPDIAWSKDFPGQTREPFKGRDMAALRRDLERIELQQVAFQSRQAQEQEGLALSASRPPRRL